MKHLALVLLLMSSLLSGCDTKGGGDAVSGIQSKLADLAKKVDGVAPSPSDISSMTTDQINKMFAIEYRVLTLDGELTPEKLQPVLSAAGQERWDCFNVQQSKTGTHVFCKRLPIPYLRYVLPFL